MGAARQHRRGRAACHMQSCMLGLSRASVAATKPLKRAMLPCGWTDSAANWLALCTNLTSCCFGCFGFLDLESLQALPNLSELSLHEGIRATGVGNLAQLTELNIAHVLKVHVEVRGGDTAQFIHGLKRLSASDCAIDGLHDLGLAACSRLQDLLLAECCRSHHSYPGLGAFCANLGICRHPHYLTLTRHLSDLTQLTRLKIFGTVKADFHCPLIFMLTNLVCLEVTFYLENLQPEVTQYVLTDQLGVLHRLEYFAFTLSAAKGLMLVLDVSWHTMMLLQSVSISAPRSMCDEKILGLAKLTALKGLKLNLGDSADDVTAC